jgi:hypothetical protein
MWDPAVPAIPSGKERLDRSIARCTGLGYEQRIIKGGFMRYKAPRPEQIILLVKRDGI